MRKPALHALHDRTGDGYAYRAELSAFVDEPLLSPHPVLRDELDLPGAWFETIGMNLSAIAATPTGRTAVRQEWISRAFPEYTGNPAPQITEWARAHGDFHAANLTTRPHDPRLGRLGHCSPGIRLPDADHDKGGDRQLHPASPDDRRPLGPAVSDDAVGLIHQPRPAPLGQQHRPAVPHRRVRRREEHRRRALHPPRHQRDARDRVTTKATP
ncbi:hypothetical protein [Streptomyces mirabilis]|uniref:hypothetical protein n=1 Tax=Streptomyces mirabilis TaxID=68239 RepID=UPI00167C8CF9|nr:hypothetical protein [Streptomyces mirabilis]